MVMIDDRTVQDIRSQWRTVLGRITTPARKKVNGETSWICPLCGNGSGTDGDGLTFNPKSKNIGALKCFGCNFSGDVIELYQKWQHTSFREAVKELSSMLNIELDAENSTGTNFAASGIPAELPSLSADKVEPEREEPATDFTAYLEKCRANLPAAADYLAARGISVETAMKYGLGFDEAADPVRNPDGTGTSVFPIPRLIIPEGNSYTGRAVIDTEYRYMGPKNAESGLFNADALWNSPCVFITEGAIDALAVIESSGQQAVALNSAANTEKLLSVLREKPTKSMLYIMLDNDDAGRAATEKLLKDLKKLKIGCDSVQMPAKDPGEWILEDAAGMQAVISRTVRPDSAMGFLENFDEYGEKFRRDSVPTGFDKWDKETTGLHPGVFLLVSSPGTGKTTWTWQMTENLAMTGREVLYFTMEQTGYDLIAKSLCRRLYLQGDRTVTELKVKNREVSISAVSRELQRDIGDRISIVSGNFRLNARQITQKVQDYISRTGVKPIVVIDYLQALMPIETGNRNGTREIIEDTIDELCRYQQDNGLIMFIVSSTARSNYYSRLDIGSLKETGRLEYSADAVWTLEFRQFEKRNMYDTDGDIGKKKGLMETEKAKNPREMMIRCVKSRFGNSIAKVNLNYFAASDYFVEAKDDEAGVKRL